jgi:hypothetical protein
MKVKNELAGKKIKCPGCGDAFAVLSKQNTEKARTVKKRNVEDDEDSDEEDQDDKEERPQKKKKQKAKGISMLVIGLIAGGVGLVVLIVAVVIGFLFLGGKAGVKDGKAGMAQMEKIGSRSQGSGREIPAADVSMQLKLIGLTYNDWYSAGKKIGPMNAAELGKAMQNSQSFVDLINSNKITVVWGIPKDAFFGDIMQVIAWETQPDRNGIRIVLQAFGGPLEMNEAEFQAAKKAKSS